MKKHLVINIFYKLTEPTHLLELYWIIFYMKKHLVINIFYKLTEPTHLFDL